MARDIEGLDDGIYHFSLYDFNLVRLAGGRPAGPAVVLTGRWFRSAWKYKERAFRYCLLDAGHAAENLMIAGKALGLPVRFSAVFDDGGINRALGPESGPGRRVGHGGTGAAGIRRPGSRPGPGFGSGRAE